MEQEALELMKKALVRLQEEKPNDRSDKDRRYAIMITDLEKIIAYHVGFITH